MVMGTGTHAIEGTSSPRIIHGREPPSLFTGEGCILVWHTSGDVFGFFFCVCFIPGR